MVPEEGVEPTRSKAPADFESAASASSATPGLFAKLTCRPILTQGDVVRRQVPPRHSVVGSAIYAIHEVASFTPFA